MEKKIQKTEEEWKKKLTEEEYHVMREKGTEAPFTGEYFDSKEKGVYRCKACGNPLFKSDAKFDSGTGWPSFVEPLEKESVEYHHDSSHGMERIEVTCGKCGAHLGHVFDDLPAGRQAALGPNAKRYCINSICLNLEKMAKNLKNESS